MLSVYVTGAFSPVLAAELRQGYVFFGLWGKPQTDLYGDENGKLPPLIKIPSRGECIFLLILNY